MEAFGAQAPQISAGNPSLLADPVGKVRDSGGQDGRWLMRSGCFPLESAAIATALQSYPHSHLPACISQMSAPLPDAAAVHRSLPCPRVLSP